MTEWISVKDQLPNDGENVLCYQPDNPAIAPEWRYEYFVAYYKNKEWDDGNYLHKCEPTHWMRLPAAPQNLSPVSVDN